IFGGVRLDEPQKGQSGIAEQGWLNALSKYRFHGDLEAEVADAAIGAHQDAGQEKIWREAVSHRSRLVSEHKPDDSN
ncbi:MAG: hypothetical protein AAGA69_10025, partial [Pseudomonadota bacterium]